MLHNHPSRRLLLAVFAAVLGRGSASAEGDKSAYWLLNPAPRGAMREMSTDRPDATESPYTVDGGHIQVELSFFEFTRDDGGPREDAFSYAPMNLKVGVLDNLDVQMLISPYERAQVAGADDPSGFGDMQLRLKWNLWGNDSGDTAFALMPFVTFPTGDDGMANDHLEGGLILPFATGLPGGFSLGLMAEFDIVRDEADEGYELDFVHSAVLGRDLFGSVGGYIEYLGIAGTDPATDYRAFFSTGLTIAVTADIQLDCGVQVGLTDEAEDLGVFAGVSFRY